MSPRLSWKEGFRVRGDLHRVVVGALTRGLGCGCPHRSEAKVIDPTIVTTDPNPSAAPATHVWRTATLAAGLLLSVAAGL